MESFGHEKAPASDAGAVDLLATIAWADRVAEIG